MESPGSEDAQSSDVTPAAIGNDGDRDTLAKTLQSLDQSVDSTKAQRWEIRERIREIRAKLAGNAEAQHTLHAELEKLKVQSKLSDVLEARAVLDDLWKKILLLVSLAYPRRCVITCSLEFAGTNQEGQQRQCLLSLHEATAGEIPGLALHNSGLEQLTVAAEHNGPRSDAAMIELMNETIVQLRIQSAERMAEVQQDRAALTRERILVDDRLRTLQNQHGTPQEGPREELTLPQVYKMAESMDAVVAANLTAANDSIKQLEDESSWLNNAHSEQWQALTKSLADRDRQLAVIKEDEYSLRTLIAAIEEANGVRELQHPSNSSDGQAQLLGDGIFEEVLQQIMKETAEYVHATCTYSDTVVRRSILSSLLDSNPKNIKQSTTKSAQRDGAKAAEVHRTMLDATAYEFGQGVSRSRTRQGGITVTVPTQFVSHVGDGGVAQSRRWTPIADETVQARHSDGHRWISGERIFMEQRISKGIHMTAMPENLTMPELLGRLTFLDMQSSTSLPNSTVVAGGSSGSFCMWTVPLSYDGQILLTAVSPKLPHNEQSPIEEIRFSIDGTSQLVTLDAKGAIRIWSIEPITRVGTKRIPHTPSLFPQSFKQYAPIVPACMAYLPFETLVFPRAESLPKPIVQTNNTRATRVCLEASATFMLRQPSVLIAVANGDVIKFNTDYEVGESAAPIINPAATPALELANPLGVQNGIEVFAADPERRGHKVRREIFNFHRTSLLFLSTAGQLDEWVVTLDTDGMLAIWESWSRRAILSVTGFHRPNRTCRIDLMLPVFTACTEEMLVTDESAPLDLESIGVNTSAGGEGQFDWGIIQASYLISSEADEQGYLLQCFGETNAADQTQGTIHKLWIDTETNTVVKHAVAGANISQCSGSVIDVKLTSTREEICFLVEYSGLDQPGRKAVVSTLNLPDLAFTFPRYSFMVAENNKVLDWAIGPLMREPLTFYAFILSDRTLRVVSLVTGQLQRIIDLRTFVPRGTLQTKPQFIRVCGRQRALVLGSPTSRHLFCCQFSHDYDGLSAQEAKDISCLEYFRQLGADDPKHYVTSPLLDAQRRNAALDERAMIASFILDTLHAVVDDVVDSREQEATAEELFGEGPLGVIYPTRWTFPKQSLEQAQLSTAMLLAFESDSSDEASSSDSEKDDDSQTQTQTLAEERLVV